MHVLLEHYCINLGGGGGGFNWTLKCEIDDPYIFDVFPDLTHFVLMKYPIKLYQVMICYNKTQEII